MCVLELIMSFSLYLRSAMVRFPLVFHHFPAWFCPNLYLLTTKYFLKKVLKMTMAGSWNTCSSWNRLANNGTFISMNLHKIRLLPLNLPRLVLNLKKIQYIGSWNLSLTFLDIWSSMLYIKLCTTIHYSKYLPSWGKKTKMWNASFNWGALFCWF